VEKNKIHNNIIRVVGAQKKKTMEGAIIIMRMVCNYGVSVAAPAIRPRPPGRSRRCGGASQGLQPGSGIRWRIGAGRLAGHGHLDGARQVGILLRRDRCGRDK